MLQIIEGLLWVLDVYWRYHRIIMQSFHGEFTPVATTIEINVPHEQRKDNLGVICHKPLEVKYLMIVQCCLHTYFVQRVCKTPIVLYSVTIGLQHIRTAVYLLRRIRSPLQQKIIVAVNTSYEVLA